MDGLTGRKILTRRCSIYGSGLSRTATLVLAKQHNEFNQIQRVTCFPEVAACCRRLMFSHFAGPEDIDDGTTIPVIPRYNSLPYISFKQECVTYLLSSQTVKIHSGVLYFHVWVVSVESTNDKSCYPDGTIEGAYLSQNAECVHNVRGRKTKGTETKKNDRGHPTESIRRQTCT